MPEGETILHDNLLSEIKKIDNKNLELFMQTIAPPCKTAKNQSLIFPLPKDKCMNDFHLGLLSEGFRQVLLTQIPGCAITRIKIHYQDFNNNQSSGLKPVLHKYSHIPGVVENVRDIIHNFGQGIFRLPDKKSLKKKVTIESLKDNFQGYKDFCLGDFFDEDQAEMIINPELTIFSYQDLKFFIEIEITIEKGIGYKRAEQIKRVENAETQGKPDVLLLTADANFNPVKKVGYKINKNTLEYKIQTDQSITPDKAYHKAYHFFKLNCHEEPNERRD